MVQHHDGCDGIKGAQAPGILGGFPGKARVSRGGRVHAKRIKAKLPQAADQSAIAAPCVKDP